MRASFTLLLLSAICAVMCGWPRLAFAQDSAAAAPAPPSPTAADLYVDSSTPEWIDREALKKALNDAGDNWQELAGALDAVNPRNTLGDSILPGEKEREEGIYAAMLWLIDNAPHLDRLELTKDILVKNIELAVGFNNASGYDLNSDLFRRYVLNYRLDDEPVTDWREELWYRYSNIDESKYTDSYGSYKLPQLEKARVPASISEVVAVACANFTIRERGYFGNLAAPLAVDNARAGTKREFAILVAAALRSQGYGTRFVKENRSGESWVEVWSPVGQVSGLANDGSGGVLPPDDAGRRDAAPNGTDTGETPAPPAGTPAPPAGTPAPPGQWIPVYPGAPEKTGDTAYAVELCGGRIAVVSAGDAFGQEQVTARYSDTAAVQVRFTRAGEELKDYEFWTLSAWYKGDWVPLDDLGYPVGEMDYPLGQAPEGEEGTWYYVGAPGEYRLTAGARYPGGVSWVRTQDFIVQPGERRKLELALDPPAELPDSALVERTIASPLPEKYAELAQGTWLILVADTSEPSVRTQELLYPLMKREGIQSRDLAFDTLDADGQAFLKDALLVAADDVKPVVILLLNGETKLYLRGYNLNVKEWIERLLAE